MVCKSEVLNWSGLLVTMSRKLWNLPEISLKPSKGRSKEDD